MATTPLAPLRRSLTAAASRRGVLVAVSGGLFAARQLADGGTDSAAKKKRNRKRRQKNNRKKNDRTEVRVDAICPGPITDNAGFVLSEGSLHAQTFTALNTGRLVLAGVLIEPGSTGSAELTLQLRDVDGFGVPTNEVLAETSLDVSKVPAGVSTVFFSFADPPLVAADRGYALVLSKTGSRTVSWKAHLGDTCDGRMFRRLSSSEPFEVPNADLDLIFTTIVSS